MMRARGRVLPRRVASNVASSNGITARSFARPAARFVRDEPIERQDPHGVTADFEIDDPWHHVVIAPNPAHLGEQVEVLPL